MKNIYKLSCVLIILVIITIMLVGCKKKADLEEKKEKFMKNLNMIGLICDIPSEAYKLTSDIFTVEYVGEVAIFPKIYDLYVHSYEIFEGEYEIASAEELKSLIVDFDSKTYDKFRNLYNWVALKNGEYIIKIKYTEATKIARDLYNEKYNENILPGGWVDWKLEDRIKLEKFIKENPDFMPKEEYADVLKYLGIN